MSSSAYHAYKNKRNSPTKTWQKPYRSFPTHPDWPDGVTIGLRVQYTGSKAARFLQVQQQLGSVEVPANLLKEVREDLTAIKFGTASPKFGNAYFSERLTGAVDIVWPAYKMRPLVDYFITYFARLRSEALAERSISCMIFYLLPHYITSLRDHPLDEAMRGFIADTRTVDLNLSTRCRNALPANYPSPSSRQQPHTFTDSPRVKREPSTPVLSHREAVGSTTEWTGPPPLPDLLQRTPMRDSILDGLPEISRKRPYGGEYDDSDASLPAKARRLAEERDIAQTRERALQAQSSRISDLERSLATYKLCISLTERRERRLADILSTVFGDTPVSSVDPLDALEHHYAEMDGKVRGSAREASKARRDLDVRAAELGFGEDRGSTHSLPVLLDALQKIAGIASVTTR